MYDRNLAIKYAYHWWNSYNPKFYNFENLGGDCTNFVSQCLWYGGIDMVYINFGWYYNNLNNRSPSWAGVDEFYNFATTNTNTLGVKAKICDINNLQVGDVVQMMQNSELEYHHTMIITKILKSENRTVDDILITAHTNNVKDKNLSSYNFKEIRFLKILN